MMQNKIKDLVENKKYKVISDDELHSLLAESIILIEKDTYISDKIRLLKFNDELLLQEKTNKNEYLIRTMKTLEAAEEFIKNRLDIYNRMWDGCGCKVNYYD